jgi:hypothetical protein
VTKENTQLREQVEQNQRDHDAKISQLQKGFDAKRQAHDESIQRVSFSSQSSLSIVITNALVGELDEGIRTNQSRP